jgi:hypothetical protein
MVGTFLNASGSRLSMPYEPTRLLDIDYVIAHTIPSSEVHSSGEGIYDHKPFKNRGQFNRSKSHLENC